MDTLLRGGTRPAKARRPLPFLMPLTGQCTMVQPTKGVYEALQHLEPRAGVRHVSFTPGFPPADIHHCGPVVVAYGDTQADADAAADALYHYIAEREEQFVVPLLTPAEAVATAMQANAGKPIVLADVQDNRGAGATSDTTGILAELVRQGAKDAVVGVLVDAEAARAAHAVGCWWHPAPGHRWQVIYWGDPPFAAEWTVEGTLGRSLYLHRALLQGSHDESRAHGLSQNRWRGRHHLDTPHASCGSGHVSSHWLRADCAKILVLKSSVHFRGDFTAIAADILVVEAPGAFIDRPEKFYRHLRPGVRLCPNGPAHRG